MKRILATDRPGGSPLRLTRPPQHTVILYSTETSVNVKVTARSFSTTSHSRRSGMDHTVLPAITPCLALPRKRSPDGATTDLLWRPANCSLLLIYRLRKDERLSWPSWLTYSGRFTWSLVSCVGRAQDSESWPVKDRRSTAQPTEVAICKQISRVEIIPSSRTTSRVRAS